MTCSSPIAPSAIATRRWATRSVVLISTRLMEDSFAIAFEFFINVGHNFVDRVGVSQEFADLAWKQVEGRVRGETSLDAYELRKVATTNGPEAEKARHEYLLATFADSIAVYMLSVYLDVDYQDLRERDYPLLAPDLFLCWSLPLALGTGLNYCIGPRDRRIERLIDPAGSITLVACS